MDRTGRATDRFWSAPRHLYPSPGVAAGGRASASHGAARTVVHAARRVSLVGLLQEAAVAVPAELFNGGLHLGRRGLGLDEYGCMTPEEVAQQKQMGEATAEQPRSHKDEVGRMLTGIRSRLGSSSGLAARIRAHPPGRSSSRRRPPLSSPKRVPREEPASPLHSGYGLQERQGSLFSPIHLTA